MGIPLILVTFIFMTFLFTFIIHCTKFGRRLYAIGSNPTVSYFSGIRTKRIKLAFFTISGLYDQGYLAAAAVNSIEIGESKGAVDDKVTAGRLGEFKVEEYYDGGTQILLGDPLRFTKENINDFKDKF